jgi:hypothetical protein
MDEAGETTGAVGYMGEEESDVVDIKSQQHQQF